MTKRSSIGLTVLGSVLLAISIVTFSTVVFEAAWSSYIFGRDVLSYWSLSEKASTLSQKSDYLDQFVDRLQRSKMAENNALFFPTPDESRDQNLKALLSLQQRMHEIKAMDVTSFQYQQAISQITAQEQGEAKRMLDELQGCWDKANYPLGWDPMIFVGILTSFITGAIGWFLLAARLAHDRGYF